MQALFGLEREAPGKKEKGAKGKESAENDGRKGKRCIKSHDL